MIKKHFQYCCNNLASLTAMIFVGVLVTGLLSFGYPTNDNERAETAKKVRKVMIDAGHGGHDPGNLCTQRYDKTEKDLALEVAMKVGKKIEEDYPDVEVLYTRTTDVFLELHERTALANKNEVDLFISIHCDAVGNKKAQGCSTYVIGPAKTDANLKLAQRENATMLKEKDYKKNYSGFDPYSPESYIEMSLRQNAHITQSLSFAQLVQDEMRTYAKRKDRGVKQAPYWVISFTTMPSVLIELGFTTNEEEEDFLRSESGQDKMSESIVKAFGKYKKDVESAADADTVVVPHNAKETPKKENVKTDSKTVDEDAFEPTNDKDDVVYFKVQIATSSKQLDITPDNFNGLKKVEEYQGGGLYKYTYGKETSYKKAKSIMKKIKEQSYPGAFIVAFKGNKRIDLADAILY